MPKPGTSEFSRDLIQMLAEQTITEDQPDFLSQYSDRLITQWDVIELTDESWEYRSASRSQIIGSQGNID